MSQFEHDLTGGSVSKQLIRFSLPFLLSNFIQALYSVTDMLVVSWCAGPGGVAGVSNGGQVTMIVTNLVIGLTVGGTVLIGQYYGARRHADMKSTIGTLFSVLILSGVALTVAMIALSGPILRLMRITDEQGAFAEAQSYLNSCMSGTLFIFGYNAVSAVLRGMGDSKRPLAFVTIACLLNVGLDILLVGGFHMRAAGAAIATVISQALSLALSVIYLARNNFLFDFRPRSFRIHPEKVRLLLRIGLPNSVQNLVVGLSFLVMMVLVNGYGVYAAAAMGIVGKFNGFAILPAIAMSSSVASMAAQNLGAGLRERAKRTMFYGMGIVFPMSLLFFLAAFFAPSWVLRIFTDDEQVIASGIGYIRTFSFDYLVVPFVFCANGLLMAAGHTTFTMISGMLSSILLRVPIALVFGTALGMGLAGIGLAAPVASLGALVAGALYLRGGSWQRTRIHAGPASDPAPECAESTPQQEF
jgi:putative MATE family efflux protein